MVVFRDVVSWSRTVFVGSVSWHGLDNGLSGSYSSRRVLGTTRARSLVGGSFIWSCSRLRFHVPNSLRGVETKAGWAFYVKLKP